YRAGAVPPGTVDAIAESARQTIADAAAAFEAFEFSRGLEAIWALLSRLDKFIVERAPWKLARQPEAQADLDATLYTAAEALRIATVLLAPVLPESTRKIWAQLGIAEPLESIRLDSLQWGQLRAGQKIGEVAAVFPRIDAAPAIEKMKELEAQVTAAQNIMLGKTPPPAPPTERIAIEDFTKVELRVGQVLSAEPVKGANKLLHMKIDIGEPQPRTIVAGIAEVYQPEQMIGRKVVIVANLQPRKLRGIESNGMIVAASLEGGKPVLAGFLEDVPIGARLK
ncbi:MAG: methionine--tRNA ligase subunit beta, partial [Bryobacteraceae bacterium]